MTTLVEKHRDAVFARYRKGKNGHGMVAVARELGISPQTVRRIINPERAERDRKLSLAAKKRRTGICEDCGGPTSYNGHPGRPVSKVCAACQRERDIAAAIWTREAIIAALQAWAEKHGRTPTSTDWRYAKPDHPATTGVYGFQTRPNGRRRPRQFKNWSDAIEAAGLPHPHPNRIRKGGPGHPLFDRGEARQLRATLTDKQIAEHYGVTGNAIYEALGPRGQQRKWTPYLVIHELQTRATNGTAPSSGEVRWLHGAARRYFGTWHKACHAAGLRPRR